MSHIHIRQMMGAEGNYAGRSWFYHFRHIPINCEEAEVEKTCQALLQDMAPITKDWNEAKNSEWIVRVYFAAKMILSSSVMAQSLEFAQKTNLRVVNSYLDYYTVLNCLRAIILTNPHVAWSNGELLKTTHTKTINVAVSILSRFNKEVAQRVNHHVAHLKAFRELISYRAPSNGDGFPKAEIDVINSCRFFAEIAQMQSELFEVSVRKNVKGKFALTDDAISQICNVEIDDFDFFDEADCYRLGYLQRKYSIPTNMLHVMSEGHVEDFFGSWVSDDESTGDDQFDPDGNWRILFDVP